MSQPRPALDSVTPHRVLLVDDVAELRFLVRTRLAIVDDVEVVGEASNGAEAVDLVRALAPEAVVLDFEMPVMTGVEAIPLMRELHPHLRILLYTASPDSARNVPAEMAPDTIVEKGEPLDRLVDELLSLFRDAPFDVLRFALGAVPLTDAVAAFDSWAALNVRILEALSDSPRSAQATTIEVPTRVEVLALVGMCAHLGQCLQRAAQAGSDEVDLVVHAFRSTARDARRALARLQEVGMEEFFQSWDFVVPPAAAVALDFVWQRLLEILPGESDPSSPS